MELKLINFIQDSLTSVKNSKNLYFFHRDKYRVWKYSFEEIYKYSLEFSLFLKKNNIRKEDKILIKGSNSPEWVIAFIGVLLCGAIVVPLDIRSSEDFDLKVFKKVSAKAIVSEGPEIIGHFESEKFLKIFFNDIGKDYDSSNLQSGKRKAASSSANIPETDSGISSGKVSDKGLNPESGSERLAEIVFTSGTTAEPKGVMITYSNLEASLKAIIPVMAKYSSFFRFMSNPRILSLVPLSHMYGQLIGIFTPMMIGTSVMFTAVINPQQVLKVIKEEKIWILGTLPRLMEMIKDYIIEKYNLNSSGFLKKYNKWKIKRWQLRFVAFASIHRKIGWRLVAFMVGGAVLNPSVDEFFRCLAYSIFQGYGLTETSPLITLSDPIGSRAGSVGRVLPGQDLKIIDGEVYVKGENVSPGYYEDKTHTVEAFKNGWFKTGDMAQIDEDGNVYFKGRKDDAIIRPDGLNIYPGDIEEAIRSTGFVRDCAVISSRAGVSVIITAFLILREDIGISGQKIIEAANKKLNVYQKINSFIIWDKEDFPRTATMKVKKTALAGFLEKRTAAGMAEESAGRKTKLSGLLNSLYKLKRKKLKPSDRLESDIGLDSIDMIELVSAVQEKYNVELDESLITKDTTVAEIENMISQPPKEAAGIPFFSFPYWSGVKIVRTLFQYFLYPFIHLLFLKKIYGKENLKNIKGPVVFAANHTSNLDTFVVLYCLPLKIRTRVTALMSIEHHFQHFFYRRGNWIRRALEAAGFYLLVNLAVNACPLSRTHGFKRVLENAGKLADRGWSLLIFPEGGVTTDGEMKKFESGIGIIAADMKMPVVPVKIEGLYNILRNGILPWGHIPRWPRVKITFGKTLFFKKTRFSYQEIALALEETIKNRL